MSKLVRRFEDLIVWQKAMYLVTNIYELSESSQLVRDFALKNQMRRSAISIPSNIAEGFERASRKEFRHFLAIAKGSAAELRTQLEIARRLKYSSEAICASQLALAEEVSRMVAKLRTSISPATCHLSLVTRHRKT